VLPSYGEKNEIAENKNSLLWQRPLKNKNRGSDRSSTAIAEPNVENRMKIHPVEVEEDDWADING